MKTTTVTTTTANSNQLTGKVFKKMFADIRRNSVATLSNGVKKFVRDYGNNRANAELLAEKVSNHEYTKAQVNQFTGICKNKELLFRACKACLPTIDGVFVEFAVQETFYKDLQITNKRSDNWLKEKPVRGETYKPWGFNPTTQKIGGKPMYIVADNETYKRTSVCVEIVKYTDEKIGKCIAAYIDLPDEIKAKI